jgi:hypothetical protein
MAMIEGQVKNEIRIMNLRRMRISAIINLGRGS